MLNLATGIVQSVSTLSGDTVARYAHFLAYPGFYVIADLKNHANFRPSRPLAFVYVGYLSSETSNSISARKSGNMSRILVSKILFL